MMRSSAEVPRLRFGYRRSNGDHMYQSLVGFGHERPDVKIVNRIERPQSQVSADSSDANGSQTPWNERAKSVGPEGRYVLQLVADEVFRFATGAGQQTVADCKNVPFGIEQGFAAKAIRNARSPSIGAVGQGMMCWKFIHGCRFRPVRRQLGVSGAGLRRCAVKSIGLRWKSGSLRAVP